MRHLTVLALLGSLGCANGPQADHTPPSAASAHAPAEQTDNGSATGTPAALSSASRSDVPVDASAIVAAADRSPEDRALDAQRSPADLLAFTQLQPGMRVADLAAGTGYTTELLARAVGPSGQVYGQNSPFILERFAEGPWSARLLKPVMGNVTRVDSEFDAPLPGIDHLDRIVFVLFYHDTVWFKTDRSAMNRALLAALKPGGKLILVDHSAVPGAGVSHAKSLHRIEEPIVIQELEAAGFTLESSADFLRHPEDPRDWSASPSTAGERRGQSDRFVLRFIKPTN